jgi:hypothetical protein
MATVCAECNKNYIYLFQHNNALTCGQIKVNLLKGTNGNISKGNKYKHIYYLHSSKTNETLGVQAVIITWCTGWDNHLV